LKVENSCCPPIFSHGRSRTSHVRCADIKDRRVLSGSAPTFSSGVCFTKHCKALLNAVGGCCRPLCRRTVVTVICHCREQAHEGLRERCENIGSHAPTKEAASSQLATLIFRSTMKRGAHALQPACGMNPELVDTLSYVTDGCKPHRLNDSANFRVAKKKQEVKHVDGTRRRQRTKEWTIPLPWLFVELAEHAITYKSSPNALSPFFSGEQQARTCTFIHVVTIIVWY